MKNFDPGKTQVVGSDTRKIPAERLTASPNERYHNRNVIGSGGMKIVLQTDDLNVGRSIAMAISKDASPEKQLRFLEEARITASLEHPNIVPVHDIGRGRSGVPYFTMKLVRGLTLEQIIDGLRKNDPGLQKRFPLHARLEIFLKVCDAIAFAHSRGIIHLDLKPDNIQVGEYGEVLVLDWGIARRVGDVEPDIPASPKLSASAGVTMDGVIRGTPDYMAPEQASGQNSRRGLWTDIYSLGAILYTLITLHTPYEGRSMEEILQNVMTGGITPLSLKDGRRVPAPLEFIVLRAMALSPERRYPSVQALREDIIAYQNGFATVAENAGLSTLFLLWLKRNRIQIYVVFSIVLTIGIVLTFAALHLYARALSEKVFGRSEQARIAAERAFSGLESRIRRENLREWKLKFSDDFTEPDFTDRWKFRLNHRIPLAASQTLRYVKPGAEGIRIFAMAYPLDMLSGNVLRSKDLRMLTEFSVDDAAPGAVVQITLNNTGFNDGYVFSLYPLENPHVTLHRGHSEELLAEAKAAHPPVGEAWKVDVIVTSGPEGTALKMSVQGKEVLHFSEPRRISALPERMIPAAFSFSKCAATLRSVKLMTLGASMRADILDIAEQLLRKGTFAAAQELFNEAEESATSPERRKRAADGLRTARLLQEYRSRIPQWEELLRKSWKGARIRFNLEHGGFHLFASGGSVRDLSVLKDIPVSGLTLLDAQPQSFEPLRGGRLRVLILRNCRIPAPSPLASLPLETLVLDRTPAANIEFLRKLKLKHLTLRGCGIESLAPLAGMKIETLDVSHNRIRNLRPLLGMPLKSLSAQFNDISSILPLYKMPLEILNLACNRIADIQALHGLPLRKLDLACNAVEDISALKGMPLEVLDLAYNRVESLVPLAETAGLTALYLESNRVTELAPLRKLTRLTVLDASDNRILSLVPLAQCRMLADLSLCGNRIQDLSPLKNLKALRSLNCFGNPVAELDPLNTLNLERLFVSGGSVVSFGTLFLRPPRELFLFHDAKMERGSSALLYERSVAGESAMRLRRQLRILDAYLDGSGDRLRSMAYEINGKRYSMIPVMTNYDSAKTMAAKLGASLPSWEKSREQAELFRMLKTPFWVETDEAPESGKPHSGCFLDRRPGRSGIAVNRNPQRALPLVLEWK